MDEISRLFNFKIVDKINCNKIEKNTIVEISNNRVKFLVIVDNTCYFPLITGYVISKINPSFTPGYNLGDKIVFNNDNILEVHNINT